MSGPPRIPSRTIFCRHRGTGQGPSRRFSRSAVSTRRSTEPTSGSGGSGRPSGRSRVARPDGEVVVPGGCGMIPRVRDTPVGHVHHSPRPDERPPFLQVTDISKTYGRQTALLGVSFTVAPGEIAGLVGPNGAGKSTTLRIICGLLKPDSGRVVLDELAESAEKEFAKRGRPRSSTPRSIVKTAGGANADWATIRHIQATPHLVVLLGVRTLDARPADGLSYAVDQDARHALRVE